MGARRVMGLAMLVVVLGAMPATSLADTYPPPVDATEVVTGDATPPATGVDADEVIAPASDVGVQPSVDMPAGDAPAVDAPAADVDVLSTTGSDVLPMLLAALALLVVGGALATISQRRRNDSPA